MNYFCKQCEMKVLVLDNEIIKACNCEAPIIGEMESSLIGSGSID